MANESKVIEMQGGVPIIETEYTRAWEERHGWRWVIIGGRYYPRGTTPAQVMAGRRPQLPAPRELVRR